MVEGLEWLARMGHCGVHSLPKAPSWEKSVKTYMISLAL